MVAIGQLLVLRDHRGREVQRVNLFGVLDEVASKIALVGANIEDAARLVLDQTGQDREGLWRVVCRNVGSAYHEWQYNRHIY